MSQNTGTRRVQSVQTACGIIDALRKVETATLSELADRVDISIATLHTHLATLNECGLVVKDDEEYRLSPVIITMGEKVKSQTYVYQFGKEEVRKLADETEESVHMAIESGGKEITVCQSFGNKAIGKQYHLQDSADARSHLHCTSSGKAILAHWPRERVEKFIEEQELISETQHTITDPDALLDELNEIRERGVAYADEEQIRGIRGVSVPILDSEQRPLGSLSLSGPVSRFQNERFRDEFPELLTNKTNVIEANIQTSIGDSNAFF